MALRLPSGVQRGRKKQLKPFGLCARTRKASHIGADMNHLCPVKMNAPPPAGSARVVLVRRSEPPWFSVMPMPISAEVFSATGRKRLS